MSNITRPIGPADMEFYYGAIVRRMAILLSGYTEDEWTTYMTAKQRGEWLDKAASMSSNLFADAVVADSLPRLASNLQARR